MSWNERDIADRNLQFSRDRRLDLHEALRYTVRTQWFAQFASIVAQSMPESRTGRPRVHAPETVAFMIVLCMAMNSQAEADHYLRYGNNWNSYRRLLATSFPDEPLLRPGAPAPTRSVVRHIKHRLGEAEGAKLASIMKSSALLYAAEMGIGVNHGTMLTPSANAGMFGDGVVIRPMTKYKRGDRGLNRRTGEWQQRRFDPDATYYTDGTGKRVYGNEFVQMSARTEAANEVITFGIDPLRKGGSETEASIALNLIRTVKKGLPGMAMVHYDKALRGASVEEVWNMQMMPVIGVYDKTGRTTEQIPLEIVTINGIQVQLVARHGAVSIKGLDGEFIPLTPTKLIYVPNASGSYRVYCDYTVPEGANCDVRLWGGRALQVRLNSHKKSAYVLGEHVRAHAPGSTSWHHLYGNRSLAESVNSWLKKRLGHGSRARSMNQTHQWIDLMIILMLRNDQSLALYKRRTQMARTASPPAA
jgi:hypothetical protein